MKIRSTALAIILLSAFVIGIGGTMAFNLWHTESRKMPEKFTQGALAGTANPADIRGSYSFRDIENAFGVPAEELGKAFNVPGNPGDFKCKDLEILYGDLEYGDIGTGAVKLFVVLYLGIPYEAEGDTILPEEALEVLGDRVSPELRERMEQVRNGEFTVEDEEKK